MDLVISNKRDLIKLITSLLTPFGFVRVKDDWYLNNGECVAIIALGKSLYGGQFSILSAFLLKELTPALLPYPPLHLCNFKKAAEFIVPDREALKTSLNLENNMTSAARINIISSSVKKFVVPFIIVLNSKAVIAHEFRISKDFRFYCDLDLKLALESHGYLTREELELDF